MACAHLEDDLKEFKASDGMSIFDHSQQSALLVVFLKFIGCVFCQQTIRELVPLRRRMEQNGVRLMFVHMGTLEQGQQMLEDEGMERPLHVSDPEKKVYETFELQRCFLKQAFSPVVWGNVVKLALTKRIFLKKPVGDTNQMPGVFLLHQGKIEKEYRHDFISDKPDYLELADCEICTDDIAPLAAR